MGNSRSPHCWHTSVAYTRLISRDCDAWVLLGSGTMDLSIDRLNTNAAEERK